MSSLHMPLRFIARRLRNHGHLPQGWVANYLPQLRDPDTAMVFGGRGEVAAAGESWLTRRYGKEDRPAVTQSTTCHEEEGRPPGVGPPFAGGGGGAQEGAPSAGPSFLTVRPVPAAGYHVFEGSKEDGGCGLPPSSVCHGKPVLND